MKKVTGMVVSMAIAATVLAGHVWAQPQLQSQAQPNYAVASAESTKPSNTEAKEFASFLSTLQKAVKEDNKEKVAKLISYPVHINQNDKQSTIESSKEFKQKYDRIITIAVKKQILKQKASKTFHNQHGFMIGEGVMWVDKFDNHMRVYSINVVHNPYEVAGIDDPAAFKSFLSTLKKEVRAGNKKAVANLMDYPLRVNEDGESIQIKTKKQFIAKYNKIITKKVKKNLLAQNPDKVFVKDVGVMIGEGDMWISQFGKKIRVYAINL